MIAVCGLAIENWLKLPIEKFFRMNCYLKQVDSKSARRNGALLALLMV
jgi:hypothetical protein